MEGYEVVSVNDDKCIGHVVGTVDDNLIVEHGTLRKTRNALPLTFAEVDEGGRRVVTTLAADLVYNSPKIKGDGDPDREAIAAHYGLAAAYDETPAEGYGDTNPDDLAQGAESDERRGGTDSTVQQRAAMRESMHKEADRPESPALLGDRYSDVPRTSDD
ncbi:MAG: hypothetical protein ABR583_09500 [Gaiellaceae bacterium]